jgi:malonate decarboxylase beta subunit
MASILALRQHAPVIAVVAGTVGCFGGMSLAAGLSSYIVMTREARLGMNGPEVIEQESGIAEFDASDRALVWAINGGEQRQATGLVDALVEDDTQQLADAIRRFVKNGVPASHRSSRVALYRSRIQALDPSQQWDPKSLRATWSTAAT